MFAYFDIILFAAVFGFCAYRLWSFLGRNPDEVVPTKKMPSGAFPQALPKPVDTSRTKSRKHTPFEEKMKKAFPLFEKIERLDPNFFIQNFLTGAESAFERIIHAFTQGDLSTVTPLLDPATATAFTRAIRDRQKAGQVVGRSLIKISDIEVKDVTLREKNAMITLLYTSEQIAFTKDDAGRIVQGDDKSSVQVQDLWTFKKNLRSADPNWVLISAHASA